ncbi:WecB/TagA/CpsF family glycosyltransferase, partial [Planktomarina temperata]|nr:WecB/TagA/CpsF family glycosyltransferase [Planktomarina temperata]
MQEHEIVNFLGIDFDVMQCDSVIMTLVNNTQPSFYYIVTPNADHVVRYHEDIKFKLAYDKAKYRICDSKVLWLLAMLTTNRFSVTPGADLVTGLINNKFVEDYKLMVLGPSLDQFAFLKKNYPKINWLWTKAPENLTQGTKEWTDLVSEVSQIDFDLLLCCLSSPKQEIFCHELELLNK